MDSWQYLTVTYNGSQFFIYLNGELIDNGGLNCTGELPTESTELYIGNSSPYGYLYFDRIDVNAYCDAHDCDFGDEELRINIGGNSSANNFWSHDDVTIGEYDLDKAFFLEKSETVHLWEDDGISDDNHFDENPDNENPDDSYFKRTVSPVERNKFYDSYSLGGIHNDESKGILHYGVFDHYFEGELQDFRIYNYTMDGTEAADLYNTNYHALELLFDEPPGEDIFTDISGNGFAVSCDANASICPDSGIPGVNNQTLRFDGEDDVLNFSATTEELSFVNDSFTVMAWVKLNELTGDQTILGSNEFDFDDLVLAVREGQLYMRYGRKSSLAFDLTAVTPISADEWYHFTWIYEDLANDNNQIKLTLYINGEEVASEQGNNVSSDITTPLVIGYHEEVFISDSDERYLDGFIDSLSIARTALISTEIKAAYLKAPVLNLHLDENSGNVPFVDETNNYNDAICGTNCAQGGDMGQMREAAVFDSTSSIIATDNDGLDLSMFTVGLWLKPTQSRGSAQQIFSKEDGSGNDINFALTMPADSFQIQLKVEGAACTGTTNTLTSDGELIEDQWNHFVATYDGITLKAYINGALDNTLTLDNAILACTDGASFILGDESQGFEGSIDEVTAYGTVLSEFEVKDIYNYQSAWFDVVEKLNIIVDLEAPELFMTTGNFIKPNPNVVVALQALDDLSGVALVEYSLDNQTWLPALQESAGSASWSFIFEPTRANGNNRIFLRATDAAGNQSAINRNIRLDSTAPDARINGSSTAVLTEETIQISGSVFDQYNNFRTQSGVAPNSIRIDLLDSDGQSVSGFYTATVTSIEGMTVNWVVDYPVPPTTYGKYTVRVSAEDQAGNVQEGLDAGHLYLDGIGPVSDVYWATTVISETTPYAALIGTATLVGSVHDIFDPFESRVLSMHFSQINRFDSNSGLMIDSSPNRLPTTCINCPSSQGDSPYDNSYGRSAEFNATSNHQVMVENNGTLDLSAFSLSLWVKPDQTNSGVQNLVSQDSNGTINNRNFALFMPSDTTQVTFETQGICGTTGNANTLTTIDSLALGQWSHIGAIYNGDTQEMMIYINGELDNSLTHDTAGICTTTNDIIVGGNINAQLDELIIYNQALNSETVDRIANPLTQVENVLGRVGGVESVDLRFRHAGGSVWPEIASDGIRLFLPMENDPISDLSAYAQTVNCTVCPDQVGSNHGLAAQFDGATQTFSTTHIINPADGAFAVSLWVNPATADTAQPLLVQANGQTWLGINNQNQLYTAIGGSDIVLPQTVSADNWHHIALNYDGTMVTLHLDGNSQAFAVTPQSSTGHLLIGHDGVSFFSGALDELILLARILETDELAILADGESWRDTFVFEGTGTTGTFAGSGDWYYEDPIPSMEGPYSIDLLTKDTWDNYRYIPNAWQGIIDNMGPQLVLSSTNVTSDIAEISCQATDYSLDANSWDCPATGDLTYEYHGEDWFKQIYGTTNQLLSLSNSSQNALVPGSYSLSACDIFGNCSSYLALVVDLFEEDATVAIDEGYQGDVHWGDYDNDDDLDILITGCESETSCDAPIAKVYANTAGAFSLVATLTGQGEGSSLWGDTDNDGDLDIVLSGNRGGGVYNTAVYENTGTGFDSGAEISSDYGQLGWGDFDNDNDLDLSIDGAVYENIGASFVLNEIAILPEYSDQQDWGDYDNDGDLDLLTGRNNFGYIYENNNGQLTAVHSLSNSYYNSNAAWGDYNADGLLDILINGRPVSSNTPQLDIYQNTGAGFTLVQTLVGSSLGSADWGDYDNDGDLDIILTGCDSNNCDSQWTVVYNNRLIVASANATNTMPAAPTGLDETVNGRSVTFDWDVASDTETDAAGLRYNVYVGLVGDESSAYSPMAEINGVNEGWLLEPRLGSLLTNTLSLTVVEAGDYAWSAQAVDGAFGGSDWATEGSFHIDGADLSVTKEVNTAFAQAGDTLVYTITFINNGPDILTDVVLTDTTSANLTNLSYQSSGISVTEIETDPYVWQVAEIESGESGTIVLQGDISGSFNTAGQFVSNGAEISSSAYDHDLQNNIDGAMTYPDTGTICMNYETAVLADAPVGYWRLSDPTSVAENLGSLGSVINGEYVGTTPAASLIWQDPTLAASFDGNDDYIIIPPANGFTGATNEKTIELWLETDAAFGDSVIFGSPQIHMLYEQGSETFGSRGLALFVRSVRYANDNLEHILILSVGGGSVAIGTIESGATHHLAITFDNGTVRSYKDGLEMDTHVGFSDQIPMHHAGDARIGANGGSYVIWNGDTNLYPFAGTIDEVAVYNNALSVDRIAAHFSACQSVDVLVTQSASVSQAEIRDTVSYVLTFANVGYETAVNVTISDTIPAELTNVTYDWDADNGVILTEVPNTTYQWTVGNLASNSGGVITITGEIDDNALVGADINNVVAIATSSTEFNTTNNSDNASFEVVPTVAIEPTLPPVFVLDNDASGDLQNVYLSSVDWGDYDGDGDLDIVLAGHTGVFKTTRIYRNDNGRFVNIYAGLPGIENGSVSWGDYNGDDLLDVLIVGNAGAIKVASVYENLGGNAFTDAAVGLTAVYNGHAQWGDYDNDDDLDIFVTGHTGSVPHTQIYNNDGGVFTAMNPAITAVYLSASSWADYDGDGDWDIYIAGITIDEAGEVVGRFYRNDGGNTFTLIADTGLPALYSSVNNTSAWGDYDNDTDLDLLINNVVYRNNGDDTFTEIFIGTAFVTDSNVAWGDYDNDGRLDFLIMGEGAETFTVYHNDGADTFIQLDTETFPSMENGHAAWGDYDHDGAMDILMTGQNGNNTLSQIWRNMTPAITFDDFTVVVDEPAGSVDLTVNLNEWVDGDVAVDYVTSNGSAMAGSDYTAVNGTATLISGTQSVDISIPILDDANEESVEEFYLTLNSATGVDFSAPITATIVISDDDVNAEVIVNPMTVDVTEGGATDSYQISLGSEPTDPVTITLGTDGETTVNLTELVFDNSDWSTPKDVTVTAVDDVLIEGAHSSSIAHVAASDDGDYNGITVSDVTANITDNDGATVTVSPTTLNLTEGLTDTYQIELDSEPTALVTVTLTTNGQTTVTPTELVFDDGNWNTAQDVTVTAVDDDIAEGVHNDTISHSTTSSDINFDGIAVDSVTVNITDNDTAGVDITPISTNVTEGGATDNYAVVLESEPTNAVTITLSTSGEATVNLTQLVFDDTDWDTPQNVTITAVNDDLVEGAHNDTVTHAATSNDGNYNGIGMSNVTVNITDNDSAGVTIIPTTLGVAEGDNDSYAVELDSEPTAPVTITLSTSGEATVNLTQLVFDNSDWDTPKNVTVTAVADGLFEGDHGDTVTHAAASADGDYNGIGVSNVTVNITDTPAIEVSPISLAIAEGGATDSYQISMASKPSDNVTIDITTDAQANASAAQLTFTSMNWATPQVVTITAVDDALFEGAHNSTITHLVGSSDGDYNGMAISNVTASVADNDGASVSVAPTTLSIAEGNNDIYEVVLDNEPTDPVTITIASSGDVTMNPTQLVFDNVNWNVTRTVTVTAVADGLFEGDHNDTINQAATSGDANYNGAAVANVTVNITDTPAIDVSPTSLTLAEVSGNDSYQVVLSSQPSDNVTVTVSTDAQLNADMTELVFTTANWDTAQTVTVNAVNDDIDEGAHNGTITHSATSSDADYNGIGLAVSNVTASITDNDSAGINVNPTAVNATEGGVTGSYQVSITSEPTGNVTVTVGTDSQVSTDLTEVVFTSLNWSDVQTVTVTAVNDDLVEGAHSGTIIHSAASSDGNYNSALISNVTTNITDNDSAAINVSESVLNIAEGSNDSYQIVLNSEPTDSVTVTLATGSELNVAPNPVVLNSGNWDTAQDVTVTAISDGLFEGNHSDTITQTVSSTDGNYSGIVLSNIAVNITDTPAVNVSVTSLFVTEDGATDSYQLVLASQPTANVTVTIGTDAQTNASLAQVFFTSANWNNSQLVTINAINDDVAEGAHNGTVTHTAVSSDGVYNGIGISNATANITDNDSSGVTVAPTTLNILENNDDTYDISLESEPTDNVTVTVAIDSQVSVNSSEVIFTSANWNSAQTITVTVNDDDIDNGNRNSTVSHSTVSADGNYNGAVVADVMVNITEDDNAGVIISPTTIDVSEAGITGTYQISLNSIPTDPVTVTVTPDGDSTVDVSTAVFTPLTWNNVQTVTVTAIDDAIVEGLHDSAISHSVTSPDSNYEAITISDLVASVADDDGVFETVTEAISYTIAYAIDIPTNADYNSTNPVYFIDNSSSIGTFDRIAYYMVLNDQWAYASLPAFTSNIKQVGIPVQNTGITFTTVTGDLNYRQDVGFGVQGSDRVQGGIEFWPDAYQPGPMRPEVVDQFGDPAGAATVFDWNDHVVTNTVSYSGSLQIARYSSGPENKCCTIMAWNNWDAPAIDDLGINDYYGSSGDDDFYNTPGDFTGAANATSYTTRTLYVLVRETNSLLLNSPTVESSGKETAISQVENISVAAESRRVMLDLTGQSYITVDLDKVAHAQPASMPVILEHASDVSFENSMTFALNGNPTSFVTSNQVNNTIGVSAITTPTFPLAVTNMQPITLTGFVASEQELGSLEVTIDGAPIYNISFGAGMTETLWTTTWTPLTEGAYEVEANLTNGVGAVVSDPTDTIIYVDLTDPEITLTTDFINQSNSQVGQIIVTGLATDTIGVMLVEGKIGDDWQLARLDGTGLLTTTFTATLPISLGVTFADNFDVTVQVTDRSGHQVTLQETLLVDLIAPSPVSMTLSANGQSISQYETIDWVENPTVDLVWGVSNDVNGIASYQVTWFDSASGSAQMVQQNSFANTQFGDSFGATEGQKLSVEITTVDGFGNSRTQTFGPVYVDFPTTPVYTNAAAPLAYNGWLQNSCYQLGHDDRLALVQPFNADVQSFFTSWDATGLRVTWQGADWETDGDMFLYLDSTTGGSRVAMNPYVETAVSTAIFLPETLDADYAIWVQDATIAILYEWNGSDWNEVSSGEFEFQFDAELASPQTDLYLPFDTISIIDPSTESVEMVAFASENDGLKLWATMPANNNLNSEQAIGAPATSDVEIFTLLNSFNWAAADAGLCPSDSQPQGNNLSSALIVDQAGVGYQLFADHLIAVQPKLLPDAADWDTAIDSLCNGSPVSRFSSDVPLPSLCQRDVEGAADAVNPARDLAHLLSTDQPPIAHGDSLSLTLQLVNNGEKSLQDVTILFIAEALLTLPGGSLNSGQYEQEINVGTLAAGTGTNVTIDAVVDAAFNAAATDGWTQLKAVVYDATGGVERPLEIHYLNHKVDVAGPSYVELQTPLSIIGEGEQSFFGFVADQSTVPTIIIELDSVEHSCENSMLAAEWRCDIDLGDLNDGDSVAVRVKAVDNHGQESAWFDATTLTVDTTSPTLTTTNVTTTTFNGGIVGPDDTLVLGQLADDHLVDYVEVCEGGVCQIVPISSETDIVDRQLHSYKDDSEIPVFIPQDGSCAVPLTRVFDITDAFTVADLDIGLQVDHPFRNDLQVWLTSPENTRIQLAGGLAGVANLNVLLNDASLLNSSMADDLVEHTLSDVNYEQQRQTVSDLLYAFRGEQAQGSWLLEICDAYPAEDAGWYLQSTLFFQAEILPIDTSINWQLNLDLPQHVEGLQKTLTIYGYDSVGNVTEPLTLSFEVDTRAPELTAVVIDLPSATSKPVVLSGEVTDAHIVSMRLLIRNPNGELVGDWIEMDGQSWSYDSTFRFAQPGTYQIWAEAEDSLGNVSYAGPFEVTRSATPYQIFLPVVYNNATPSRPSRLYLPIMIR
ncbi:MAG: DUF11 domain-containing protein [Chloroflexi bacterium]|nr:DUF11 domain-containing protein [Chloroflexota bacterium]